MPCFYFNVIYLLSYLRFDAVENRFTRQQSAIAVSAILQCAKERKETIVVIGFGQRSNV